MKKALGILMALLLLVACNPLQSFANPEPESPSADTHEVSTLDGVFPQMNSDVGSALDSLSVGLYKDSQGVAPLTDGDTVSKDDKLWFMMKFTESGGNPSANEIVQGAAAGTKFTIPSWPGILVPESIGGGVPLTVTEDGSSQTFGMLYYGDPDTPDGPDKVPYVVFDKGYWGDFTNGAYMTDGFIGFECSLDLGNAGPQESVSFTIPYGDAITLKIAENQPEAPRIDKSVTLDTDTMQLFWTATYTVGTDPAEAPYFIDTFPNASQLYQAGSFELSIKGGVFTPATPEIEDDGTATTLGYDLSNELAGLTDGDTLEIAYTTIVTDEELIPGSSDSTITNNVQIKASKEAPTAVDEISVTKNINKSDKTWITKTGVEDPASRTIEWEVNIHTMDRNLENLIMYDKLDKGLALMADSVTVNGKDLSDPDVGAVLNENPVPGKDASYALSFDAPYDAAYTIMYKTRVDDSYYEEGSTIETSTFNNNARLEFNWKKYNGNEGVDFTYEAPGISKGAKMADMSRR